MSCAWYIVTALIVTLYQGYRGFMFQWLLADRERWTRRQRVILLCIADSVLYLVSTAVGFASLWLAWKLCPRGEAFGQVGTGAAGLIAFLGVVGVVGVVGQLPNLIQRGKLPWSPKD